MTISETNRAGYTNENELLKNDGNIYTREDIATNIATTIYNTSSMYSSVSLDVTLGVMNNAIADTNNSHRKWLYITFDVFVSNVGCIDIAIINSKDDINMIKKYGAILRIKTLYVFSPLNKSSCIKWILKPK